MKAEQEEEDEEEGEEDVTPACVALSAERHRSGETSGVFRKIA